MTRWLRRLRAALVWGAPLWRVDALALRPAGRELAYYGVAFGRWGLGVVVVRTRRDYGRAGG